MTKVHVKEFKGYEVANGATHYTSTYNNHVNAFYKELGSAVFYSHSRRHDWLLDENLTRIPRNAIELPFEDTAETIKDQLLNEGGLTIDKKIINCRYNDNDFLFAQLSDKSIDLTIYEGERHHYISLSNESAKALSDFLLDKIKDNKNEI